MKTAAFELDGDTKYLILPNPLPDKELIEVAINSLRKSGKTEEEIQAIPMVIVDTNTLPLDRTFRAALRVRDGKFTTDMDHARIIHLNKIRRARDAKLFELDKETLKHLGDGSPEGKAVEAKKQILRDIPQTVDLTTAKTPDELKAIWPKELGDS